MVGLDWDSAASAWGLWGSRTLRSGNPGGVLDTASMCTVSVMKAMNDVYVQSKEHS